MPAPQPPSQPTRVCYPFIGDNVGGSHISTAMLIEHLDRRLVAPLVVLHEEGKLGDYLGGRGLDYELLAIPDYFKPPYWSLRNFVALARQTWRIAAYLRRHRVDVVHGNDLRTHFGWTLASRLAGTRWIWHQRTGGFGRNAVKLLFARLAHQIVCISPYTASTLPASLAPRSRVVANPFETGYATADRAAARRRILERLDLPEGPLLIGFFGNLVAQKRPTVFLRAIACMKEKFNRPFVCLLFGAERGTARAELETLADELNLGANIHFMGFQTPIEPCMAGCDLVISPGVGEGLGRTLVEAMIVGTPVVAADSGGHRDVIVDGHNGLLAEADDPQSFAAAALRLMKDRDFATSLAATAQAEALERYSIEKHVAEITAIYLEGRRTVAGLPASRSTGGERPC